MSALEIRVIGVHEAWAAVELAEALQREEAWPARNPNRSLHDELVEDLSALETLLFVAWHEEQPIGMLQIRFSEHPSIGEHLTAGRFYVVPEWRHRGVGRKLLEKMVALLPADLDLPMIILTKSDLPESYQRLGFRTVSQVHEARYLDVRARLVRQSI